MAAGIKCPGFVKATTKLRRNHEKGLWSDIVLVTHRVSTRGIDEIPTADCIVFRYACIWHWLKNMHRQQTLLKTRHY